MASSRYASLTPVAPVPEDSNAPHEPTLSSRRWAVGLAASAATLVACTVLAVIKGGATQRGPQEISWDALSEPFRKYEGELAMPDSATQYDGMEDMRDIAVWDYKGQAHIFAVGDWGAPVGGHMTAFHTGGGDEWSQYNVANAMKTRAKYVDPQYVLNVGDNFYMGGIEMDCNQPPSAAYGQASNDFSTTWQAIYGDVAKKPWLSTLGNHDYGGWQFNQGWPQQIGYSFVNHNWVMPARYFTRKMQHPDFVVEYFMIDSNVFDAKGPGGNPEHNMCSQAHNPWGAECSKNGPGLTQAGCKDWFWSSYKAQKAWLEQKLAASTADWKIVVTHFPCGYDGAWYRSLRDRYGLDLLVTGHRHQQELWWNGTTSKYIQKFMAENKLGDLTCFVTGGGGGITHNYFNDADYGTDLTFYGFFDLTISKKKMKIELVGIDGKIKGSATVFPLRKNVENQPQKAAANTGPTSPPKASGGTAVTEPKPKNTASNHTAANHIAANHTATNHIAAKHTAANHIAANHTAANHIAANHIAANHTAANHASPTNTAHATQGKAAGKAPLVAHAGSVPEVEPGKMVEVPAKKDADDVSATTTEPQVASTQAPKDVDTKPFRPPHMPPMKPYEPPPMPTLKPYVPPPMPTIKPYEPPPLPTYKPTKSTTTEAPSPTTTASSPATSATTAVPSPTTTSTPTAAPSPAPQVQHVEELQFKK